MKKIILLVFALSLFSCRTEKKLKVHLFDDLEEISDAAGGAEDLKVGKGINTPVASLKRFSLQFADSEIKPVSDTISGETTFTLHFIQTAEELTQSLGHDFRGVFRMGNI